MEVVELMQPRGVGAAEAAAERTVLAAADLLVVPAIRLIEHRPIVADHQDAVDVAVDSGANVAVDASKAVFLLPPRGKSREQNRQRGHEKDANHACSYLTIASEMLAARRT